MGEATVAPGPTSLIVAAANQLLVSAGIGIFCGLLNARLFRLVPHTRLYPIHQTALVMCFGYLSYCISEGVGVSGILSLFLAAVTQAHYVWASLSKSAQLATRISFVAISDIAEGFAFSYVGLSMFSLSLSDVSVPFSLYMLLACLVSRFATVFLLSAATHAIVSKPSFSLSMQEQFTLSLGGVVRGCLCWASALQVWGQGQGSPLISAILIIVISTTILGGILLPILIHVPPPSEKEKRRPLYRKIIASTLPPSGGGVYSLRLRTEQLPPSDRVWCDRQRLPLGGGDPRTEEGEEGEEGEWERSRGEDDETSSTGSVYSDIDDIDKFFLQTWAEEDAFQPVRSVSEFARSGGHLPTSNSFSPRFSAPYTASPHAPPYPYSQRPPFSPSEESTYSTHLDRTQDDDETSNNNFSRSPSPVMSPHGNAGESVGENRGRDVSVSQYHYTLPTPTRRPRLPSASAPRPPVLSPSRREQEGPNGRAAAAAAAAAEHTSVYLAWSTFDDAYMKPVFGGTQRVRPGHISDGPNTMGSAGAWDHPLSVDVRPTVRREERGRTLVKTGLLTSTPSPPPPHYPHPHSLHRRRGWGAPGSFPGLRWRGAGPVWGRRIQPPRQALGQQQKGGRGQARAYWAARVAPSTAPWRGAGRGRCWTRQRSTMAG